MQNHEYEEAVRRELRAHQLASIRLQRLEAERQAVLDMAMQRSLGLVHQPTSNLYYVDSSVSRPVLEDSWWAAPVRPRSYEPWQAQHQLPSEPFLIQRSLVTDPPVAPLRTWTSMEDAPLQRKNSFGVPSTDRNGISSKSNSSDQPSFPMSMNGMPSPSMVAQRPRSKLKIPSKNKKVASKVVNTKDDHKVVDPNDKPKKRGRPLGSKNGVTTTKRIASPAPTRHSWNDLGLGTTRGTPAYNAHQRAVYRTSGQPLPEDLTALDFARKIYSSRVRKAPLPDQLPLQKFLEKTTNDSESQEILAANETYELVEQTGPKEDTKKRGRKIVNGGSDLHRDGESVRDVKLHKKEKKKKKGKISNGSTAFATTTDAVTMQTAKQQTATEPLEVISPFPHALHRLYQTILHQDMDDCLTDMQKSHECSVEDVRTKIQGFEDEIAELDKREHQIVMESKQLNGTNLAVLEEAYRLLGVMPPEGC